MMSAFWLILIANVIFREVYALTFFSDGHLDAKTTGIVRRVCWLSRVLFGGLNVGERWLCLVGGSSVRESWP